MSEHGRIRGKEGKSSPHLVRSSFSFLGLWMVKHKEYTNWNSWIHRYVVEMALSPGHTLCVFQSMHLYQIFIPAAYTFFPLHSLLPLNILFLCLATAQRSVSLEMTICGLLLLCKMFSGCCMYVFLLITLNIDIFRSTEFCVVYSFAEGKNPLFILICVPCYYYYYILLLKA